MRLPPALRVRLWLLFDVVEPLWHRSDPRTPVGRLLGRAHGRLLFRGW